MNKPNEYDAIADLDYLAYWGKIAADYARQKLEGRMVEIELDELAGKRGYYGRILAYVYVDGADFGAEMIKKGYARTYVEGEFRKELEYTTLEEKAKSAGVGLWAAMQ
jgi:micrococcal nuclease